MNTRLAKKLRAALAEPDRSFIDQAAALAAQIKRPLYLVGGPVRDLLLDRPITDLDLTVEGEAIDLAQRLAKKLHGSIKTHDRFGTAKLILKTRSIDLATTRTETYAQPGALPAVTPGNIEGDLIRRDFSINAIAIRLDGDHFGELIDLYQGTADLKRSLMRVLHPQSFTDDPTRIFRAARFAQRFNFKLDDATLKLMPVALPVIDRVSGDRLRREFESIFKEDQPDKALALLEQWGVLNQIDPEFHLDAETRSSFRKSSVTQAKGSPTASSRLESPARTRASSNKSSPPFDPFTCWAWLLRHISMEGRMRIVQRLNLLIEDVTDLNQVYEIQQQQAALKDSPAPSILYRLLNRYSDRALRAAATIIDDERTVRKIDHFIDDLRGVKIWIDGHRLQELGLAAGPSMRHVLESIREAVLDGLIVSPQQVEEFAKILIARKQEGNKPGFAKKPWL
jgi:tRNA nucleotidyltransferase (CCA-adding enzyme)